MGWIAPVVSVIGTVVGLSQQAKASKQQAKAADAQLKQQKVEQRIADVRAARARQEGRADARVRRAQQIAAAFGSGAQNSSALAGSLAGASADLASNIGFNSMIGGLSQQASIFNIQAGQATSKANTALATGKLASNVASIFGGPTFS